MSRYLTLLALVALVASGCGTSGSHATLDTSSPTLPTGPAMPLPGVPTTGTPGATGDAAKLVQAFQAAWTNVRSLSGQLKKDVAPSRADSLAGAAPENERDRERRLAAFCIDAVGAHVEQGLDRLCRIELAEVVSRRVVRDAARFFHRV